MLGVSAMGVCPIHHIDLMAIGLDDTNLAPTCIKCKADKEPKLGRVQTAEDPGEAFFNKGVPAMPKDSDIKVSVPTNTHGDKIQALGKLPVSVEVKFEDHISNALSWLRSIPMPKDLKQFKSLQKAISILEGLEKTNG